MKSFTSIAKIILVLVALTIGTSVVFGQWSDTPGVPPGNNVAPPLHSGSAYQVRSGNLLVQNDSGPEAWVSSDEMLTFLQTKLAVLFGREVTVGMPGGSSIFTSHGYTEVYGSSYLYDNTVIESATEQALLVNGGTDSLLGYRSANLVNSYDLEFAEVCATSDGDIVLCDQVGPLQNVTVYWTDSTELCGTMEVDFAANPAGGLDLDYAWQTRRVSPTTTSWQSVGSNSDTYNNHQFARDQDTASNGGIYYTYEMRVTVTDVGANPDIVIPATSSISVAPRPLTDENGVPCSV